MAGPGGALHAIYASALHRCLLCSFGLASLRSENEVIGYFPETRLKIALEDAKNRQLTNKNDRKTFYDKKYDTEIKRIDVGDYVLVKNETGTKLDAIWTGPFEVIKTSDSNVFIKTRGKEKKVHQDNIKIFRSICSIWIANHM